MSTEKRIPVRAVRVVQHCDDCGGKLIFTGKALMIYPPKYVHACDDCGKKENLSATSPTIEYETIIDTLI